MRQRLPPQNGFYAGPMIRSLRKHDLLARQPAIVDVEVGVEECLALCAEEGRLGYSSMLARKRPIIAHATVISTLSADRTAMTLMSSPQAGLSSARFLPLTCFSMASTRRSSGLSGAYPTPKEVSLERAISRGPRREKSACRSCEVCCTIVSMRTCRSGSSAWRFALSHALEPSTAISLIGTTWDDFAADLSYRSPGEIDADWGSYAATSKRRRGTTAT